jgi:predicted Rossmann fold nucleotide-binding protein DprA/Smf involved in DNA uptake
LRPRLPDGPPQPSKNRRARRLDLSESSVPKQLVTAQLVWLTAKDPQWPPSLVTRLGENAPQALSALGNVSLLPLRKTAFFCSARTPGDAILRAHDAARRLRDEGITVISGFHSPIEKECLHILLRGKQPIIVCPARAIETMRIPTECRAAFDAGRLLFLSPFAKQPKRVTKESAARRNEVVAALADEAFIAHVTPGGHTEWMVGRLRQWAVPIVSAN